MTQGLRKKSNLLDRDLKTLGQTSKKMHEIVKKEIEARDQKLKELLAPFCATRQFNVLNPKKYLKFLVGDSHGNLDCLKARSKLVGHLSRRAPVFFVSEGYPSMKPLPNDFFKATGIYQGVRQFQSIPLLQSFPEELIIKENIYGLGWDLMEEAASETRSLFVQYNSLLHKRMLLKQRLVADPLKIYSLLPAGVGLQASDVWRKLGKQEALKIHQEGNDYQLDDLYHRFSTLFLEQSGNRSFRILLLARSLF